MTRNVRIEGSVKGRIVTRDSSRSVRNNLVFDVDATDPVCHFHCGGLPSERVEESRWNVFTSRGSFCFTLVPLTLMKETSVRRVPARGRE